MNGDEQSKIEKPAPGTDKLAVRMKPLSAMGDSSRFSTWMRSIWRQRWLSLVAAWTICVCGWTAVALWPSNYMSSAVVYADLHRLADQDTLAESRSLAGQSSDQGPVALLKMVLLSEQSLADVRKAAELDDLHAGALAENIMIRATAPTLFVTSYDHGDPTTAHQVLETLFSSFSSRLSKAASENVADLQQNIIDLEDQLRIADLDLKRFQQGNADYFEGIPAEAADVAVLREEVSELQRRIERAIIARDDVAQQLAQLPLSQQAPDGQAPINQSQQADQAAELAALEAKLEQLRERYADSHPYVSTVINAIQDLKAAEGGDGVPPLADVELGDAPSDDSDTNEQLDDLKRLHEEKIAELSTLNNNLAKKQREIDRFNALTESTSSVEAEQSRLETKKNNLEGALAELVSRRDELQQQTDGQAGQQGSGTEQTSFRLINGPNFPDKPTGPSRLLCLVFVLLAGIGIGGAIAILRNQSKGVFESAWQLKKRFDVGVLGTISEILSPAERKQLGYSRWLRLGCLGLWVFSAVSDSGGYEFADTVGR